MTHSPAAAAACALEVSTAAVRCEREGTAAAMSQCAAAATVMAATGIGVVSARRLRSAPLRRGPTIAAAAATTPTATGFAQTGTIRIERHDAVGIWCSKPMVKSSA
jgi:hypothetical protein